MLIKNSYTHIYAGLAGEFSTVVLFQKGYSVGAKMILFTNPHR